MIKQIFTWWNYQTVGTYIHTLFFGKLVGKDSLGNKYFESRKGKRWVIYKGEINASKITSDWFSWMHHTTNDIPSDKKQKKQVLRKNQKSLKLKTI